MTSHQLVHLKTPDHLPRPRPQLARAAREVALTRIESSASGANLAQTQLEAFDVALASAQEEQHRIRLLLDAVGAQLAQISQTLVMTRPSDDLSARETLLRILIEEASQLREGARVLGELSALRGREGRWRSWVRPSK